MIQDVKSVSQLLGNYGIDYNGLDIDQRENLELQGDPDKMTKALEFLVNILGVPTKKIEKCPSVLYLNTGSLKRNYEELISKGINREKIVGCLHILSSEPGVITNTYDYIFEHYGVETFNKNVSILGVPLSRIKEIEEKFGKRMSKQALLSVCITTLRIPEINTILNICEEKNIPVTSSFFQKGVGEINEIINICLENNIEITGSVFRKSSLELKKVIQVCREKGIELTGSVFLKDAEEVGKIADTCRKHGIPITGSVFRRDASEIDEIVEVCNELGIPVSGTVLLRDAEEIRKIHKVCNEYGIPISANVFKKSASEIEDIALVCKKYDIVVTATLFKKSASSLEKSLSYVRDNYGKSYMIPLVVVTDRTHLERVFPHLDEKGTLTSVIASPAILTLKFDEILERESLISSIGEDDVVNGRFNPIYGLSRKKYDEKKKNVKKKGVESK